MEMKFDGIPGGRRIVAWKMTNEIKNQSATWEMADGEEEVGARGNGK